MPLNSSVQIARKIRLQNMFWKITLKQTVTILLNLIEALVQTMSGSHFVWTSLSSVFGMQQWQHPLLLCSTSWHLLCLWTPEGSLLLGHSKGHIQWQEQRQNPDYRGQSWESEDKAVGVSRQCLLFCPLLQFPLLCFLSCVFTLMAFHLSHSIKTFSIVHLLYGSEWKRISMLYSSHCITSVCAPNKDQCTTESA